MHLTDQITSATDLVWIEHHDQFTNSVNAYETRPGAGLYGSIRFVFIGREDSKEITPAYQYRAHVGNQKTGNLVYDLEAAKQSVYNALCLLSKAGKPGKIKI